MRKREHMPELSLVPGGRESLERALVRIAAMGTSDELGVAVRRLASRASFSLVERSFEEARSINTKSESS